MTLIQIEWKRWWRSKRFLLLLIIFIFSGLTSPILTYYSQDIITNLSNTTTQTFTLPTPTWQSLWLSYLKNASQISLFLSLYLICSMCALGKSESLKLFYYTRTNRIKKLYLPKIFTSLVLLSIACFVGQLSALYVIWVLFPDLSWYDLLISCLLQWLALIGISLFAICLSLYLHSVFFVTFFLEFLIMLGAFLSSFTFSKWLPTTLLYQTNL